MFLHFNNTENAFRSIKAMTLIIVVLYLIFCCYLISESYQGPSSDKAAYSASLVQKNAVELDIPINHTP